MAATSAIFQNIMRMQLPNMNKRNILFHATSVGNKQNKQMKDKLFSYPILCPSCHPHQRKHIKTNFTQLRIYFNVSCQVHIVGRKFIYKTWTFYYLGPKYRGEMVYQTMHCSKKNISKVLRQKLVEWIMKNPNVRESPIACNTLLINANRRKINFFCIQYYVHRVIPIKESISKKISRN